LDLVESSIQSKVQKNVDFLILDDGHSQSEFNVEFESEIRYSKKFKCKTKKTHKTENPSFLAAKQPEK
jgi:hypothetical protein